MPTVVYSNILYYKIIHTHTTSRIVIEYKLQPSKIIIIKRWNKKVFIVQAIFF